MSHMTFNPTKFKELLLLLAERSVGDPSFGKTKLNKLLYYIDFTAFGQLESPVTGATYQHRPYGPVPREILGAMDQLVAEGALVVESVQNYMYRQARPVALRRPDLSVFSVEELALVDDVLGALKNLTGAAVSELSHMELGWKLSADGERIPYETVFLGQPVEPTAVDIEFLNRELAGVL